MRVQLPAKLKISKFTSINQLLLQYTTAEDIIHLPLAAFKSSNYVEKAFFDSALFAEIGFDFYITTPYPGYDYMPVTGVFYLQDDTIYGILISNHFSTASYPQRPQFFRIGLAWTFYN